MKVKGLARKLIFLVLLVGILTGFTVVQKGYDIYRQALDTKDLFDRIEEVREKDGYTKFNDLPGVYVDAIVSVEDKRFFHHIGIDPVAIGRAVLHDIQAGRFIEGGSTITQQLAKNLYFNQDKEITRKAAEVFMAMDIEKNYTKEEIFELYVNCIYFGDGYYGIGEASKGYLEKTPKDMNEFESTLLAGVPNAPSKYAPSKNMNLAKMRQKKVLSRMVACGYLSTQELETVAREVIAIP
ncbi:biosynthetic peptidoglycan transglycosylase [Clostridium sp. E02]|uniref:biosynthetic peptidoglycan transglycosylase n=1 Tax=Clostridium sp. E02 TaxID=2487134 RepID=UPI0019D20226|nr:biosynthetic peptidoglycan transglycosylase [Clostridium sp. E02]